MASRTITTTASVLLPQNRLRKSVLIQNEDAAINVFVGVRKPDAATITSTDHEHRLGPGGTLAMNTLLDGKDALGEQITIIAASGTPLISFFETEEERR